MTADFKPRPRIIDKKASIRKLLADPTCRACGQPATNSHHLLGRGQRGDDFEDNLIPVCGSGSHGCHGALHGSPYMTPGGRRWEAQDVRRAIGMRITPAELAYLVERLSEAQAEDHLRRNYHVEIESLEPLRFKEYSPW